MTDEELIERLRAVIPYQGKSEIAFMCHVAASTIERLLAALDEDALEEAISDSLDVDWHPRDAARLIRKRAGLE